MIRGQAYCLTCTFCCRLLLQMSCSLRSMGATVQLCATDRQVHMSRLIKGLWALYFLLNRFRERGLISVVSHPGSFKGPDRLCAIAFQPYILTQLAPPALHLLQQVQARHIPCLEAESNRSHRCACQQPQSTLFYFHMDPCLVGGATASPSSGSPSSCRPFCKCNSAPNKL